MKYLFLILTTILVLSYVNLAFRSFTTVNELTSKQVRIIASERQ
jgi:hypothetical protein